MMFSPRVASFCLRFQIFVHLSTLLVCPETDPSQRAQKKKQQKQKGGNKQKKNTTRVNKPSYFVVVVVVVVVAVVVVVVPPGKKSTSSWLTNASVGHGGSTSFDDLIVCEVGEQKEHDMVMYMKMCIYKYI